MSQPPLLKNGGELPVSDIHLGARRPDGRGYTLSARAKATCQPWSTAGRANYILDNLIAEKKARPMVVVMTAGHTPPNPNGARSGGGFLSENDDFARDFVMDVTKKSIGLKSILPQEVGNQLV